MGCEIATALAVTTPMELVGPLTVTQLPTARFDEVPLLLVVTLVLDVIGIWTEVEVPGGFIVKEFGETEETVPVTKWACPLKRDAKALFENLDLLCVGVVQGDVLGTMDIDLTSEVCDPLG